MCLTEVPDGCSADGPVNMPSSRLEVNGRIAATLAAPVLMILDAGQGALQRDLTTSALLAKHTLELQRAEVIGVIVNQVWSQINRWPCSVSW